MPTYCESSSKAVSFFFFVQVWDLRQNKLIYNMHGHGDSVTGLSLSSEGSYLLSNSMDNTGKGVYEYIYSFKKSLYSGHNTEFSMAFLSVFLCSAYLGCSTICTQGEMCQDFPGQCSQL